MGEAVQSAKNHQLSAALRQRNGASAVRLQKTTSNLFRDREDGDGTRLDVRDFCNVLEVNPGEGWVDVEGMTTYDALVAATLPHGVMPAVVPQLKSITIGGAVSGIGIESSSFRYGLPHETVLDMDVLLGDGEVVTCTPGNNHRSLFFGMANSYGTLGYILRLRAKVIPTRPYVHLRHIRHSDPARFFADLQARCDEADNDFVDGVIFASDELYISVGRFVDQAPYTSDYTWKNIYYRSIRERETDYLTVQDYIWRWDTDWFWCSKHVCAQHPLVRRLLGRDRLNSVTYTRIMRLNSRLGLTGRLYGLLGRRCESVIQDVDIPIRNAPEFFDFFRREIGILPIWVCPFSAPRGDAHDEHDNPPPTWPLFRIDPDTLYVNFGFWDVVRNRERQLPEGYYNRKIERQVQRLDGIKSLYSDAYFEPDEFWRIYNKPAYDRLKSRYDPQGAFRDLYQKTVLKR